MKAIRNFSIEEGLFQMKTSFLPDEDSLDDPISCKMTIAIDPDSPASQAFFLDCQPDFPLNLRLQEACFACSIISHMFNIPLKRNFYETQILP